MPFLIDKVLMFAKIRVEFVTCIYIKLNDDQSFNRVYFQTKCAQCKQSNIIISCEADISTFHKRQF